ncbi:HNH/ENDO VII family nuclease [Flavivirga aquatica]
MSEVNYSVGSPHGSFEGMYDFIINPEYFHQMRAAELQQFGETLNQRLIGSAAMGIALNATGFGERYAMTRIRRSRVGSSPKSKTQKQATSNLNKRKFYKKDNDTEFEASNGLSGRVYRKDDTFDADYVSLDGRTNLKRMEDGDSPVVMHKDGKEYKVDIHHMIQHRNGPFAEVDGKFHKDNHGTLHIWTGGAGNKKPQDFQFSRSEFNKFKKEYWQNRASQIQQSKSNNNGG